MLVILIASSFIRIIMRDIVCLILCLSFYGCQSKECSSYGQISLSDTIFVKCGTKELLMNDLDYPTSGHIRYYERNNSACLVQGNESQKTIRVYGYTTGEKCQEIPMKNVQGEFFAYSSDTAFVIANRNGKSTVSMYDGDILKTVVIPVKVVQGRIEQYPRCRMDGGVFVGGKWYFSCFRLGEYPREMRSGNDRFPLVEVDFEKRNSRFLGAYPEVYAHNNMGTLNYWVPDLCGESHDGRLLVGFKASPEMLLLNPASGEIRFVTVKSLYADIIPLPLTEKGRDYFQESDSYYYYAQYSHYGPICYDRWRKVYYRFVGIGLDDWNLEPSPLLQNRKKWSVMVFDESFYKLGEQYLGDAYLVDQHFVSPDGLYILNKGKNEDKAVYTLFQYVNN